MQHIIAAIQNKAKKKPLSRAVVFLEDGVQEKANLTYAELNIHAKNLAAHLQAHQLAGQRVLLLYPTGIEFIVSLLGCWYAKAIAVPINCPKSDEFEKNQDFINSIAQDAGIAAVMTLADYAQPLNSILTANTLVLCTDALEFRHDYAAIDLSGDDIAYLQYTSGSTSKPKAAVITQGNLAHSLKATIDAWNYSKKSVTVNWAPHSHVYGLICGLLVPIYHGTPAIIMPSAVFINKPELWLAAITKYKATHGGCPNFGYDLCVNNIPESLLKDLDLSHWQVAVNGGDMVKQQTITDFVAKFNACGFQIQQFSSAYGMSELTGAIAVTPFGYEPRTALKEADKPQDIIVSSGRLLKGLKALIVDAGTGKPVDDGEIGEIWLTGASVAKGYWQRPEETEAVFNAKTVGNRQAYFRTGDLGCLNKQELFITGRLKELIVLYGKKYYPLDLELVVASALHTLAIDLPQIIFSTPIDNKEQVVVVQELAEEYDLNRCPEVNLAIRQALAKAYAMNVYKVVFVPKGILPKTASGKLQRKKCELLFKQKALITVGIYRQADSAILEEPKVEQPVEEVRLPELDGQLILFKKLIAEVLNLSVPQIDMSAPLSRYEFDSVNIIQLTSQLNELFQLALSPAVLYEYATLADFYQNLHKKKQEYLLSLEPIQETAQSNDIAIIGMSGIFPKAKDVTAFWGNLSKGVDCISEVPAQRWDWRNQTLQWGGFIEGIAQFDAKFFNISPREAELIDPQQRLFLQTTWKAIEDAGYTPSSIAAVKTGLFVGVFNHDYAELLQDNDVMDAYLTTGTMNSMIANRISYLLNLRGPSATIDTACSSSLVAIHHATQAILQGDCELAVAGGVNMLLSPTSFISAHQAGMLSSDGRCKTFDKSANGYVRGEGVAALLLKKLDKALQDNDSIYAVIKGSAINHGGHVNSLTAPNPNAQAEAIVAACQRAQIPVDSIQYIETHGTGTPLGDPIEINGLKKAFEQLAQEQQVELAPQSCALGAVKTHIGHLESAAGVAGLIKILLSLQHQSLPANLHLEEVNPYIELQDSPFYLLDKNTPWPKTLAPRRAGISSFGFGGANAHVIIEEAPYKQPKSNTETAFYPVALSAKTPQALHQKATELLAWLENHPTTNLKALSYTLNLGREHFEKRACFAINSLQELAHQLALFLEGREESQTTEYDDLAKSYLQGQTVDWQQCYGDYQERISLPTYPFAKESYWVKSNKAANSHALIDNNVSTLSTFAYSKQFRGDEFYLLEHQVNQESVLPGALCLEMARLAAAKASENKTVTHLNNILWKKSIKAEDLVHPLQVQLKPEQKTIKFSIVGHEQTTAYLEGEVVCVENSELKSATLDIAQLKKTLLNQQSPKVIYDYFKKAGLTYGPNFQVIQALYHNDKQLLAELALNESMQAEEFVLHPCLFDGMLQTTQALLRDRDTLYLPFSTQQITLYKPLPAKIVVIASLTSEPDNHYWPNFDIQVTDEEGQLVLSLLGFTLAASNQELSHSGLSTQYYQPHWRQQSLQDKPLESCAIQVLGFNANKIKAIEEQFKHHQISSQLMTLQTIDKPTIRPVDYIILALEDEGLCFDELPQALSDNYFLLNHIAKTILQSERHQSVQILVLTQSRIIAQALTSFAKTLQQEQPQVSCRCIALHDMSLLPKELSGQEIQVRYDENNQRFCRFYQQLPRLPAKSLVAPFKRAGVYIITGGLGGLGAIFARYLAQNYQAHIVLTSRRDLTQAHQAFIHELEQQGAVVSYIQADIASKEQSQILISQTTQRFGALHGIIHAAGLTQDAFIINKQDEDIASVFAPKIQGTINLHQASQQESLDFFILTSSVAAVFGNAGQSDYASANAFMDEFAVLREEQRKLGQCVGITRSISWPLWEEGGIQMASEYQALLEEDLGIRSLATEEGLQALACAMQYTHANCVVLPGYQHKLVQALEHASKIKIKQPAPSGVANKELALKTETWLKELIASTVKSGVNTIESHLAFEHYGIDSLMIIQLNQALAKTFDNLPKTLFFEYLNLADLTQYFLAHQMPKLMSLFAAINDNPSDIAINSPQKSSPQTLSADIAIIGMDGRYPKAQDIAAFWDNLKAGKDCISEVPAGRWNEAQSTESAQKGYNQRGGFLNDVDKFDPLFFNISPREAALMDPQERLFLQTAWKTVEDAGYAREQLAGKAVGVYVGVMYGHYQLYGQSHAEDFVPTNSVFASIANRVSYCFDFHGPSLAIDTMCSSSLTALHLACKSLQEGECELALAGGVNLSLHPNKYLLLNHGSFLSSDGYCRSFGEAGDGYVPGEAVGAVLLKRLDNALVDGDHVYAVIKGSQLNHGGKTNGYTVPNPNAQAELIAETYRKAGIEPSTVSYLEAHGTGTALGDPIEIAGLNKAFNATGLYSCHLGSVKSNIGHCESAAGIAALTKVVLQLQHKTLVPSLWSDTLNSNIDWSNTPFVVQQSLSAWEDKVRIAGISSFGAGGANAHVIVEQAPESIKEDRSLKSHYLFTLSAKTQVALTQKIADLLEWLKANPTSSLAAIAYTLNKGRSQFNYRAAWVVSSLTDAIAQLEQGAILQGEARKNKQPSDLAAVMDKLAEPALLQECLDSLAKNYVSGEDIDWDRVHASDAKIKLPLPTYPFAKESYWYKEMGLPLRAKKISPKISAFVEQQARALLKLDRHSVDLNSSLGDYGMDSVHFVELAKSIANHFEIEFTPAVFYTQSSISGISQYLIEHFPHLAAFAEEDKAVESPARIHKMYDTNQQEPIAIIGMHGVFPQSDNLAAFWQHLLEGNDLITEVPAERWDWAQYYGDSNHQSDKSNSKWGGFINNVSQFDAAFFNISAREANFIDPQQRLMLETAWKTLEDAGLDPMNLPSKQVGVFTGVEFNDYQLLMAAEQKELPGFIATGNSHSMLANRLSYFFDLQGPSEVVDTACSSSLVAIHRAVQALRNDECHMALAGGVSLNLHPSTSVVISQLGALSSDGRCKTFDQSANGYVKGEGVATLLLKPLNQAQADGDHVYAIIRGSAVNHGGKAQSLTAPNATAQRDLLVRAYSQAGIDASTITYIETHGTGTALGDPVEIEGLKLAFSQLLSTEANQAAIGLGSVKTNIGHLEPASGIAGVIKLVLSMMHETIPGLLHLSKVNSYINLDNSPFYIAKDQQTWTRLERGGKPIALRAGVSSFGFGGTNAHLVLEEGLLYQKQTKTPSCKPYYLITLSARLSSSLQQKIADLHQWLQQHPSLSLADLSATLNAGRAHFTYRCAMVVASLEELMSKLALLINGETVDHCLTNQGQSCSMHGPVFDEVYQSTINSLASTEDKALYRHKLFILADLYIKHYVIDWKALSVTEEVKRLVGMPSYPFIKQRHWYDLELNNQSTPLVTAPAALDLPKATLVYLQSLFAEKLGAEACVIDEDATYEMYGVDSVMGLEITNRLEKDFGTLPKTLLYERNKLSNLAQYFIKGHKDKLSTILMRNNITMEELSQSIQAEPLPLQQHNLLPKILSEDIAIIGLNGTFPEANTMDEFWQNLVAGKDCVGLVPEERWDYKDYAVQLGEQSKHFPHGGFIPDVDKFDPLFFNISPRDAGLMDPQERLFMQSVWATLEDAGYTREKIKRHANNNVGVFAGMTYNFYPLFAAEQWHKGNRVPLDIQSFSLANRVSYFLDINGPSLVIDTACSSSLAAIHLACESLRQGNCAMAIAGGVNLSLHPSKYHFLGSFSFMSEQGRCTSFAEGGTGYVPSEGVGAVLLKPLSKAQADNDRIYGVIKGSSMNHGGKTSGYTVPNPNAQTAVILQALENAQLDPSSLSYIEAHGTGTALGDPIEIRGLQDAFETFTQDKQYCAIGSVKSNIGHLESAAGVSQLAKVLLQMQHKQLVPSIHTETLNSFIDFQNSPFYVQRELQDWLPKNQGLRRAGVSSFGAGGANVHMIVEEYLSDSSSNKAVKGPYLFVLSALNEDRLQAYVKQMHQYLQGNILAQDPTFLSSLCFTLQTGREAMSTRMAVLFNTMEELLAALNHFPQSLPNNVWFSQQTSSYSMTKATLQQAIEDNDWVQLAQYWVCGSTLDWLACYQQSLLRIISLPTYPFAKRRCWIPTQEEDSNKVSHKSEHHEKARLETPLAESKLAFVNAEEWLYQTQWVAHPKVGQQMIAKPGKWLIFSDLELGLTLQQVLDPKDCIYCFMGNEFKIFNEHVYYINPKNSEDYHSLMQQVRASHGNEIKGLIYIASALNESMLDRNCEPSLALLYLFKALVQQYPSHDLLFALVSQTGQQVQSQETIDVWQHYLWSMTSIFNAEQASYQSLLIDLDSNHSLQQNAQFLMEELNHYQASERHIAYRAATRYSQRFMPQSPLHENTGWVAPQAALITGGLGALGYEVAEYLASQGTRYMLLTGVSALSNATVEKNNYLSKLHEQGVQVHYAAVDVADKEQMADCVQSAEKAWGQSIDSVFHLAGVTTDNITIKQMDEQLWAKVLRVKVQGSLVLHDLFLKTKLVNFVLFSSIASVPHFGMAGLSAYAVANQFMNGLALYRRSLQLPASSINWVAWSEKGMSHRHNHDAFLDAVGMASLSIGQGISLLDHLLKLAPTEITVCRIQWQKFLQINGSAKQQDFFKHFAEQYTQKPATKAAMSLSPGKVAELVLGLFAKVMALDSTEIDETKSFQDYGMDSILGIHYTAELGPHFPDVVSPMDLYRYPSLKQLVHFIQQKVCHDHLEPTKPQVIEEKPNIEQMDYHQLNELLESELKELEMTYD